MDAALGKNELGRGTAYALSAAFLATLILVPVARFALGVDAATTDRRLYPMFDRAAGAPAGPTPTRPAPSLFGGAVTAWQRAPRGAWSKLRETGAHMADNFKYLDRWLAESSPLSHHLARPLQEFLMLELGAPNEQAYLGRDGWLFYRPALDYVTGPGFLSHAALARASQRSADPRPAIFRFAAQLRRRGIELVLVPAPAKATVHPENFSTRPQDAPVQNPSWYEFIAECESNGVTVFDAAPLLVERARTTGQPQFLATDTHWTPDAVRAVARALADELRSRLPVIAPELWVEVTLQVTFRGDIATMLELDGGDYRAREYDTYAIGSDSVTPWRSDPDADVLLLGDSYTNIYSVYELGWGIASGFAEHLAFALQRPVQRIARNDDGAFATREALARRTDDPLDGVRIVVWEFAARELLLGDWR